MKQEIASIVEEYFSSGDIACVISSLDELPPGPEAGHYFVKKLLTLALDRHDREREMASLLLSTLYVEALGPEEVQKV